MLTVWGYGRGVEGSSCRVEGISTGAIATLTDVAALALDYGTRIAIVSTGEPA